MLITLTIPGFSRYSTTEDGVIYQLRGKKFTKVLSLPDRNGYLRSMVYNDNGVRKKMANHRLVYSAFTKDLIPGLTIDHLNGKKDDNRIQNLEQVTFIENNRRRATDRPIAAHNRKLTIEQAAHARKMRADGKTYQSIANIYGLHWSTIRDLVVGSNYRQAP